MCFLSKLFRVPPGTKTPKCTTVSVGSVLIVKTSSMFPSVKVPISPNALTDSSSYSSKIFLFLTTFDFVMRSSGIGPMAGSITVTSIKIGGRLSFSVFLIRGK